MVSNFSIYPQIFLLKYFKTYQIPFWYAEQIV